MLIRKFDSEKGVYLFEVNELETETHAHPALEIIVSQRGSFWISTSSGKEFETQFAIIPRNVKHRIRTTGVLIELLLAEHHEEIVFSVLRTKGTFIPIEGGIFFFYPKNPFNLGNLYDHLNSLSLFEGHHEQVLPILNLFNSKSLDYSDFISEIRKVSELSESRTSHLFKYHIGISLKKYLVWVRLKKTVISLLDEKKGVLNALLANGFYDQAHFINAYRRFFGVKPTFTYNSRTLQFFKDD